MSSLADNRAKFWFVGKQFHFSIARIFFSRRKRFMAWKSIWIDISKLITLNR